MAESARTARVVLAGIPIALGFISLIDPRIAGLGGPAVVLALLLLGRDLQAGRAAGPQLTSLLLTSVFAITGWSEPRWCCDAAPYYMYLRSAVFDWDFNFANEWAAFGTPSPQLTNKGLADNAASVGPALLWAPFVLLAHGYVLATRALDLGHYAPTGYSAPYLLATAAGTGTLVVVGALALWRTCARHFSRGSGTAAVLLGLMASTLPYYVFVVPSVSHGPVFGASALFLTVWLRVEREPSLKGWLTLAALLGVVSLFRWQAVVLGLMFVPLFTDAWRRRIGHWWWAPAAVLTSALVFSPQAGAWWVLYGSPLAAPTRFHGMDWNSPHFIDVLLSADRGLFTWTPAMALGCAGWLCLARSHRAFAWSAWAVFLATTWVNGSVAVWSGGDAFGARRFDLLIPLWIFGLAVGIQRTARVVERQPLVAPALVLCVLVAWNAGLMRLHRNGVFAEAAPLEEVAARQASIIRRTSENWLGRLAGARGRNFAYRMFVGRYFYVNTGFDGRIDLTRPSVPYLSGGWSERTERTDFGAFRFVGRSGACVKVPFERAFDLRVVVSARSMVEGQVMGLSANGARIVQERDLPMDWNEAPFVVPAAFLNPGENLLCLSFSAAQRSGRAAAVRLIQLP